MSELRCSRATLFKLLKDKEIDSFLLAPNARRIPRTEIEEYMKRKLAEDSPERGAA
jgi:excisionase family DNA binding protein